MDYSYLQDLDDDELLYAYEHFWSENIPNESKADRAVRQEHYDAIHAELQKRGVL